MSKYKRSPIFYMGNKYKLLKDLIPLFPNSCDVFVDLFGGSGVVSMNYQGKRKTIYNEFNDNIVELIKMVKYNTPEDLHAYWNNKIKEYHLETCSIKAKDRESRIGYERRIENYNKLRTDYNKSTNKDYKDLFLLACYSINHLIRFNTKNEFNASSGADSYNEKNYQQICDMHETFKNVIISNNDALSLDLNKLEQDTFVYCDPPYLNTEAVYNEKRAFGGWTVKSDYKLFSLLEKLSRGGIKWGLSNVFVNRGRTNQHLIDWCNKNNWNVYHLDRNYNPFSRGNSNNDEVYVCNYVKDNQYKQLKMF